MGVKSVHQGAGRIDQLAEPLSGSPDVRVEVDRLVRISPPRQPVVGMGHPPGFAPSPLGNRGEPGIVRPGQVNLDILHPLAPGKPASCAGKEQIRLAARPHPRIEWAGERDRNRAASWNRCPRASAASAPARGPAGRVFVRRGLRARVGPRSPARPSASGRSGRPRATPNRAAPRPARPPLRSPEFRLATFIAIAG